MDIPLAKSATAELMDERGADVTGGEGCDDDSTIEWVAVAQVADGSTSVVAVCCCVRFDPNAVPPAAAVAVDPLINFRQFDSHTKSATDVARASASDVVAVALVVATAHRFVFGREVRDVITEEDGGGGVGRVAALRPFIFGPEFQRTRRRQLRRRHRRVRLWCKCLQSPRARGISGGLGDFGGGSQWSE